MGMRKSRPAPGPHRPPEPPRSTLPSTPRGRGGSRLPAAERRDEILKAAFPLFARRGYEGTTTRELALAAGVTEPILYRHFPSKEALFEAVFDAAERRILDALAAAAGDARGPARLEAIAAGLDGILGANEDEFRLVNGAAASHVAPETARRVRDTYVRIGDFLTAVMAGAGLRRGVSAETAGYLLLEIGLGASLVRPVKVPVIDADGFRQNALKILTAGIYGVR